MFTIAIIIHIIVCLVIIVAVLLQSGKGASMGSSFGGGGSQALFGSAGPAGLFVKVTGVCVFIFMLTSIYITYSASHRKEKSVMDEVQTVREAPAGATVPVAPLTDVQAPVGPAKNALDAPASPSLDKPALNGGVVKVEPTTAPSQGESSKTSTAPVAPKK